MKNLPIACTLSPGALAPRRSELERLIGQISERRLSDEALVARFESSPRVLSEIAEFVNGERECCPFLRFEIVAEVDSGPIWLSIKGPPGTGPFLEQLIGLS